MNPTTRVPAGWYPDPRGLPQLRWWDNHAWTEHTSDARVPLETTDAVASAPRLAWAEAEPATPTPARAPEVTAPPALSLTAVGPAIVAVAPIQPIALAATDHADLDEDWGRLGALVTSTRLLTSSGLTDYLVHVTMADSTHLLIDTAHNCYWWELPLDRFPLGSRGTRTATVGRTDHPTPTSAGHDLEPLLWIIGSRTRTDDTAAAPGEPRRKLRRWPNLTAIEHSPEQMTMIAMLAHAHLTSTELARIAGVELAESRSLLNTLALMNLLVEDEQRAPAPTLVVDRPSAEAAPGLFGRLRRRLGL